MLAWLKSTYRWLTGTPAVAAPAKRSGKWPAVRKAHLAKHPACAACGGRKSLNVHHCVPFQIDPSLELVDSNLLVLCESRARNCHLVWGHLLSWQSWNSSVREDAESYRRKVEGRPGK